jgi:hypothetical protein
MTQVVVSLLAVWLAVAGVAAWLEPRHQPARATSLGAQDRQASRFRT